MNGKKIGFAMCGSFCTFSLALKAIDDLLSAGAEVVPIMSDAAYGTDTRFGTAEYFKNTIRVKTGNDIIHTITQAEPLGPAIPLDALVIAPCTGNTLAKLANGIADSAVTLAVKAHLRNLRPVVIGVSTNDALGAAAQNIGRLLSRRSIYFVPLAQEIETAYKIQFYHFGRRSGACQISPGAKTASAPAASIHN